MNDTHPQGRLLRTSLVGPASFPSPLQYSSLINASFRIQSPTTSHHTPRLPTIQHISNSSLTGCASPSPLAQIKEKLLRSEALPSLGNLQCLHTKKLINLETH